MQLGGWHSYLAQCVKAIPSGGTYLEIGTLTGGSLIAAYEGSKMSGNSINFIAIDWYFRDPNYKDRYEELKKRCAHIPNLRYIGGLASEVVGEIEDDSVDVLLEDSDPTSENLVRHIQLYWPKIKNGGVWLGEDYYNEKGQGFLNVKEVYDDVFRNNGKLEPGTCLFVVEKVKDYRPNF